MFTSSVLSPRVTVTTAIETAGRCTHASVRSAARQRRCIAGVNNLLFKEIATDSRRAHAAAHLHPHAGCSQQADRSRIIDDHVKTRASQGRRGLIAPTRR
jgi:hypothetical protein